MATSRAPGATLFTTRSSVGWPFAFLTLYLVVLLGIYAAVLTTVAVADPQLPWHRIVRADGSLAKGRRQRRLLVREGVPFRGEKVDMRVARLPE